MRNKVYEIFGKEEYPQNLFYKFVLIWMSRKCNSKCGYCYQDGDPNADNSWSFEKADRITSMFLDEGYQVQPIVNEWLPEFWDFLKIMKKCQWKEITTNGLIIINRYKDFFPLLHENNITDIRHTLFPKGIHEEMTGRERNNTIKAINLSKEHGFRVVVNYVVTNKTLPRIVEVCDELAELNVDEVQFMNLIYLGRAKEIENQMLTVQDLKTFWDIWKTLIENKKYDNIEFDFQANFGPSPYGDHVSTAAAKNSKFCIGGMNKHGHFLYITPENNIYPCFLMSDDPRFKIGEIVENNFGYSIKYNNVNGWEEHIPHFSRAQCGSLQSLVQDGHIR